jgi:hypothetical protein
VEHFLPSEVSSLRRLDDEFYNFTLARLRLLSPTNSPTKRRNSMINPGLESPTTAVQKLSGTACPFYEMMHSYGFKPSPSFDIFLSPSSELKLLTTKRGPQQEDTLFNPTLLSTLNSKVINSCLEEFVDFFYSPNREGKGGDQPSPKTTPYNQFFELFVRRLLGRKLAEMKAGELVGERALREELKPRTASVVTMNQCDFLVISKDDYDSYLKKKLQRKSELKQLYIAKNFPVSAKFSKEEYWHFQKDFKEAVRSKADSGNLIDETKQDNLCIIIAEGRV